VVGEILIGGAGLARGYWGRADETAEKFLSDPFSHEAGARVYRTGDMGRRWPDGRLECLGRNDHQVKVRGYRIELGEVEAALVRHDAVREAAVVALEGTRKDVGLVGYVLAKPGAAAPTGPELREHLRTRLPDYMMPSTYVVLERWPLTPNGKVDRKALPQPDSSEIASQRYEAPRNSMEEALAGVWAEVLEVERVGIHDNFFELGGHSLLAVRLTAQVEKLSGHKVPVAALFQAPTVAALAQMLTNKHWAPPWSSLVPLQPLGSKPPIFFAHGWGGDVYSFLGLAQLLAPDQPAYGLQAVGLDGKSARHITVEDMAAHYVKEVRSFQPEGPYYLGGYSMGGVIAFEMAQQLHRLGQRVALLGLLDCVPIGVIPWAVYALQMASYIPDRCLFHFRQWRELPRCERFDYFRGRWAALRFWIARNRSKPPVVKAPPPKDSQPPQVPGFGDYYHALASAYRLHRYPGSADVFVSDEAKPHWVSSWRHLVRGGVSFHRVPGAHLQILAPDNVPVLAKAMRTALHRAQHNERPTAKPHTQAKLVS
jgi:thioesterase domain-containing protein/acyl carrier protein